LLPRDLNIELEDRLGVTVESVTPVSGGCISQTGKIVSSGGTFFAKWGEAEIAQTYAPEREGLNRLRALCGIIRVPEVIDLVLLDSGEGMLLMEWIDVGSPTEKCWSDLGAGLAELHEANVQRPEYGFDVDNFIGGSVQKNDWRDDWAQFFCDCRLQPQWEAAGRAGLLSPGWSSLFSQILEMVSSLLPSMPRNSLVHGDLWSGNVLADMTGRPVIIDPAVYYGHGEVDLAMSTLFGRFPDVFYRAYNEAASESTIAGPAVNRRAISGGAGGARYRDTVYLIYNLYHLLNHLNLFGTGYQSSVESTMRSINSAIQT